MEYIYTKLGTAETRLDCVKVKASEPAEAVVGVERVRTGVLLVRAVVVEVSTWLFGVVRLTLKTSLLAEAGITTTKEVGLDAKMFGWMTALFWVTVRAKYLLGQPLGRPVPVMVNLPPEVEMLVGELEVIAALTTKRYALVYPVGSTRTLTLYCPA